MSKKTQADAVQESAQADEATVDQVEKATEQALEQVRGRALVDLLAHGIKCSEFGDLPVAIAQSLAAAGEFDPRAVEA